MPLSCAVGSSRVHRQCRPTGTCLLLASGLPHLWSAAWRSAGETHPRMENSTERWRGCQAVAGTPIHRGAVPAREVSSSTERIAGASRRTFGPRRNHRTKRSLCCKMDNYASILDCRSEPISPALGASRQAGDGRYRITPTVARPRLARRLTQLYKADFRPDVIGNNAHVPDHVRCVRYSDRAHEPRHAKTRSKRATRGDDCSHLQGVGNPQPKEANVVRIRIGCVHSFPQVRRFAPRPGTASTGD